LKVQSSITKSKDSEMAEIPKNSSLVFKRINDLKVDSNKQMNEVVNSRPRWEIQKLEWEIQQRDGGSEKNNGNKRLNKSIQWKATIY
jgi:ribosomal protein L22